jgi:peptide/nickel transport system substrate-binding protein/oligopeptide transport system substrate-binding protein
MAAFLQSLGRRARTGLLLAALIPALAGALTGCGSRGGSRLALAAIAEPGDSFDSGPRLSLAGQLARAATAEGLVAIDEKGRVVPALADRWIVTDDGLSYIFRLRDGDWRSGEPLTARSAKLAIDAVIRSVARTPLALDLNGVEQVRVMAGRVIEIRLLRPMPYLLQILAQPELGLLHKKQGDGPMAMSREGRTALFTPIEPSRLGLPQIPEWSSRTRTIEVRALGAADAVNLFNDGQVDLVLGGRIQDFPLTSSVDILRGTIQLDPVMGLFGLRFLRADGFLADPANREALAMAIDRGRLIEPFGVDGWTATTRLISPNVDGDLAQNGERWQSLSIEARRAQASARVRAWQAKASGSATPPSPAVRVWLPQGPGSDILFGRLASDMNTIGVTLQREHDLAAADLALVDEVARYPRVSWFLNRLACLPARGLCDKEADDLVAGAVANKDSRQRAQILSDVEAKLTADNVFIPLGTPIRWSLVRGNVDGFATNPWAWHPLMPLAWVHK